MHSNQLLKITFLLITLVGFFITSCKQNTAKTIQPARDYALIFREISSVIPIAVLETQSTQKIKTILTDSTDTLNTCASFYYISGDTSTSSFQNINFNIDYKSGCVTNDNSFKEGIINCYSFFPFSSSEGKISLNFSNFRVDGNLFSGTIVVQKTTEGFKATSNNLSISVGKKAIVYSGTSKWVTTIPITSDTLIVDNHYQVSDSCQLTSRYGDAYTCVSTNLYKLCDCRWFTEGITEIVDSQNETQIIDYGKGTCENKATVSSNNDVYNVDLQ